MLERFARTGPLHGRLLDVGAGRGVLARALGTSSHLRIIGLDRAFTALGSGPRPVVQGDCGRMPFADGSFDILTAVLLLEHLPDDGEAFMAEAARLLVPGGRLCLVVPNARSLVGVWLGLRRRLLRQTRGIDYHHPWSLPALQALLHRHRFRIERVDFLSIGDYHGTFARFASRLVVRFGPAAWREEIVLVARRPALEPPDEG
ncbi:MAG: methyltransferase domain-containing protein [Magnetococcales bacterium]|nr:methyltransferase domain-containing protein [Magnetococcales bacterium]